MKTTFHRMYYDPMNTTKSRVTPKNYFLASLFLKTEIFKTL